MAARKPRSLIKLITALVAVTALIFVLAIAGIIVIHNYQLNQMKERGILWQSGLTADLPIGTSFQDAKVFFVSYGSQLECITSSPVRLECTAHDPQKFGLLPKWHIFFELEFDNENLTKIQHRMLGVGL